MSRPTTAVCLCCLVTSADLYWLSPDTGRLQDVPLCRGCYERTACRSARQQYPTMDFYKAAETAKQPRDLRA